MSRPKKKKPKKRNPSTGQMVKSPAELARQDVEGFHGTRCGMKGVFDKNPDMREYVDAICAEIKAGNCNWSIADIARGLKKHFGDRAPKDNAVDHYVRQAYGGMRVLKDG